MKTITVSFDVDDQNAEFLKNYIRSYNKFSKSKQASTLEIIENFLRSWDPAVTDVIPDERVQHMIKLTRPVYLLLMIKRESRNFKFKVIERKTNA